MKVYEDRMRENLGMSRGLIFSESLLIRLVDRGLTREQAYKLVQRNAMEAWKERKDFKQVVLQDQEILAHLSADEVEAAFDTEHALRWVDAIFDRAFK
jgi:adenylosuccinate lyase